MRSPLTAMMFGIELTHDINSMLPLAIGCATAHATTVLLMKRSILTEKVARRGHHVVREYVVDPFETMRISDIMARPVDTLPSTLTVREAIEFFTGPDASQRHKSYPVVGAGGRLTAVVSRADALQWLLDKKETDTPLGEQLAGQDIVISYEDELVGRLADRMAETGKGRIPIINRQSGALVGLVARRDLLRVRANMIRHEQEREKLIRLLPD
jgi:CBS domain-containing protein